MKTIMNNRDFKYSIYKLWDGEVINWLAFRQEMFRYFDCTKGDSRPTLDQMNHIKGWAKRYKERRDRVRISKLD